MPKFLVNLLILICSASLNGEEIIEKINTCRIPQIENESVKVWKTIIMPGQPLKMHRHDRDRIVVGLKGGILTRIEETGETSEIVIETGKAYWFTPDPPGTLHGDINQSDEPIEVMLIELKSTE